MYWSTISVKLAAKLAPRHRRRRPRRTFASFPSRSKGGREIEEEEEMENARDARRRRILERGSDRLALISGQVQSNPDSSPRAPNEGHPPPSDAISVSLLDQCNRMFLN